MKHQKLPILGYIPVFLLVVVLSCNRQNSAEKPNILFIAVDDLRDCSEYNQTPNNIITPAMATLARNGMVFSNAYCSAPVCSPSRTSLLTGLSPSTTGVYENGQQWPNEIRNHVTLTRFFMENGYYTAGFGKIYHGQGDLTYWHDYIYGEYSPMPKKPDNPYALGNPLDIPDSLTGDGMRVNNAIAVLQNEIDSPLFLACGLVRPHTPWNVPRKYFEKYPLDSIKLPTVYSDDLNDIPEIGQRIAHREHTDNYGSKLSWTHQSIVDSGLWKINIQAYLASITFADAQIGRLIEAWNQSDYSKNGIIVLWGDHGWHLGEKQHWSKRTLWEEGTKTPLIIVSNEVNKDGSICATPVSLLDIFPTLVELCNFPTNAGLEGKSLVPFLKNPKLRRDTPVITVWGKDNIALRNDAWRYIRYCDNTRELYNHENDPAEQTNLANLPEYQNIMDSFEEQLPECRKPAQFNKKRTSWFEKNNICYAK